MIKKDGYERRFKKKGKESSRMQTGSTMENQRFMAKMNPLRDIVSVDDGAH